jgi:hypothetical protein
MTRLKIALVATFAVLGLFTAPAQAFGPMMLLMMPMMMGGHQHGGDTSHKDSTAGHADAPQAPVDSKYEQAANDGGRPAIRRLFRNTPTRVKHTGATPNTADEHSYPPHRECAPGITRLHDLRQPHRRRHCLRHRFSLQQEAATRSEK